MQTTCQVWQEGHFSNKLLSGWLDWSADILQKVLLSNLVDQKRNPSPCTTKCFAFGHFTLSLKIYWLGLKVLLAVEVFCVKFQSWTTHHSVTDLACLVLRLYCQWVLQVKCYARVLPDTLPDNRELSLLRLTDGQAKLASTWHSSSSRTKSRMYPVYCRLCRQEVLSARESE